ncbi:hypothetical protein [Methylorubrum populi]|nr:hypothetical protein [Methylorubrum populi]
MHAKKLAEAQARDAARAAKPKPDPVLYADFLAALTRVIEHGETVTVHGHTISWPKQQPNYYALHVDAPRTVRDPWTGALHTIIGQQGGSACCAKKAAASLAFQLMHDRESVARMLADAKPGILNGTVTHIAPAEAV